MITIHGRNYERADELPRWAYTDDEWLDLKLNADLILDGHFYNHVPTTEPVDDEIKKLFDTLL